MELKQKAKSKAETKLFTATIWKPLKHFCPNTKGSFLGKHNDTAYYFYYSGNDTTTLNHEYLAQIKTKAEQYVNFADNCLLSKEFVNKHNIIFKKIPRDITRF